MEGMKKRSFILGNILCVLLIFTGISFSMPPPCEFYPDSGYQGEILDLNLYLLCGVVPYSDELPIIIFNVPGIQVLEVSGDSSDDCLVKVKISHYTAPGTYSPYIIFRGEVVLTPEEADSYWLTLTVLESPPRFFLYPENPQRRGTFGIYLISGINTNFKNGSTFILSSDPEIFPALQFVFSPTDLLVILWVGNDVEAGSYDLTIITEDGEITENGIFEIVD